VRPFGRRYGCRTIESAFPSPTASGRTTPFALSANARTAQSSSTEGFGPVGGMLGTTNRATSPAVLCSTTVSTLSRLLGVRVVRDVRFQDGAGRCVFRVDPARPRPVDAPGFAPEPEREPA
jgi:hypothetical protein